MSHERYTFDFDVERRRQIFHAAASWMMLISAGVLLIGIGVLAGMNWDKLGGVLATPGQHWEAKGHKP